MKKILVLLIGFLLITPSLAQQNQIATQINQLIQKTDPNIHIGIEIIDLQSNQILYEKNANQYFRPASNLKLLTAAAALLYLGPDFQFNTELLTNAEKIQDHVLQGNLYLRLSGDPTLNEKDLKELLTQLSHFSIKTIQGDFIIETPLYDDNPHSPGTMLEDTQYYYAAKNMPLILNQNTIGITVNPASQINHAAYVSVAPTSVPINIHNQLTTASPDGKKCSIQYKLDDNNDLWISGCISQQSPAITEYLSIKNPLLYTQITLKNLLKETSIQFNGNISIGTTPTNAKTLVTHASEQLFSIVYETLKKSNNLFADALFLKLGEQLEGNPGNWEKGTKAVKKILSENAGVQVFSSIVKDGSGISYYNLITPHQIVQLLSAMSQQFGASYEFIAGLPMNGSYGSLAHRMSDKNHYFVRAKTGTSSDTTALSGYLETADQKLLAFSIMINHTVKPSSEYKILEDQICTYLTNTKIGNSSTKALSKQPNVSTKKITYKRSIEDKKQQLDKEETDLRKNLANTRISIIRNKNTLTLIAPIFTPEELSKISSILKEPHNHLITIIIHDKNFQEAKKITDSFAQNIDINKILTITETTIFAEPIKIVIQ